MIEVMKSPTADSRTANGPVTEDELRKSTRSHQSDVTKGLEFIAQMLKDKGPRHDHTKFENIEDFCAALNSGHIKDTDWYTKHITEERHHLKSNVPDDVNLADVIEHIVDCTMAGLTRSGDVYDVDLDPEVLQLAVNNTVKLIKKNTHVNDPEQDIMDQNI